MRTASSLTSSSSSKPLYGSNNTNPSRSKCISAVLICCLLLACILAAILTLGNSSNNKHKEQHQQQPPVTQSPSSSVQSPRSYKVPEAEIISACKATRSPGTCKSSLTVPNLVPPDPTPLDIIQSAFLVSSQNLKTVQDELNSVKASSTSNQNLTNVAKICVEVLGYSQSRISQANESLPSGDVKSTRAWISAALSYVYDCSGGLRHYTNDTSSINETMSNLDKTLNYTSNALSMVVSYDLYGNETESWSPPETERDGFWKGSETSKRQWSGGRFPSGLKEDVVVCKDGANGCYKTVQEAVNAAPSNASDTRFVIRIKKGIYEEIVRVPFDKKNVVFLGDGRNKTVITGSLTVAMSGVTTYDSATVGVLGDGFMASGLTIQNTAGAPTHQAVAFRSDSDRSFIEDCEFIGNQDTLYAHSLRQYYKSCRIQGNIDFIFGNAAAIFEDCQILVSPRLENPEQGDNSVITASGRIDPAQSTGFVFLNCSINGTQDYLELYNSKPSVHLSYLGRPWKEYARTVYINCVMAAIITPQGWMPWSGDFALNTLYFGESGNSGPGSNASQRVSWSSRVPSQYVNEYSVQNFIQGEDWIVTSSR